MSSRKKNILATIVIESPNKTAHLPSGAYSVAVRKTWIEGGTVKAEIAIIDTLPLNDGQIAEVEAAICK